MNTERRWRVEVKWWLSAFAALLAVLLVFALVKVVLSLATIKAADLAAPGTTGDALGFAAVWPIQAILAFYPFMIAAALGFRLLVPTFAGAPPRAVAVVVTTWPVALGAQLVGQDLVSTFFYTAIGIAWGLAMPLPKTTALSGDPINGGAIVGLAFGALAFGPPNTPAAVPLEFAILWCAIRLLRGKSIEVAATAMCAAIMPALFLATQLPHASLNGQAVYRIAEVIILGVLALIGFIRSMLWLEDADPEEDAQEEPADMVEATQN